MTYTATTTGFGELPHPFSDGQDNMESFNTELVINPFESFAERLALALNAPHLHQLYDWLTAPTGAPPPKLIAPPSCAAGRRRCVCSRGRCST